MIILDTNVVSERFRPEPDRRVKHWLRTVGRAEIAITAITVAELRIGTAGMAQGHKRVELESKIDRLVREELRDRIEDFDLAAADMIPRVISERNGLGRPITMEDAMIAAICLTRGAMLATRNTKDFDEVGITLIDPWKD
ncbi:type II toxin-antitoxin system VapC family toxin [Glycomyces sp. YM15]|uniref:type II toxin-antitoxin system VapC family toxin n=1 Tax=Glycomyces sp. YM15 TaxID=2800446 RepID=UPI001964D2DC|nr:type II toxin-antitoxin system VapC family toxin [Glycomyces sp. YM15]